MFIRGCIQEHRAVDPKVEGSSPFGVRQTAKHFKNKGYEISCEHPVKGNGAIDILAQKAGERIAVEVETGKSNIKANLTKTDGAGFDRIVFVATSPTAVSACQKAIEAVEHGKSPGVELLTWLDI